MTSTDFYRTAGRTGVVIIGRNEGVRLVRCIESVLKSCPVERIVYVDSGSTDESGIIAGRLGVAVVNLDMGSAFSAARARNEGFASLTHACPGMELVQFLDGDCELQPGWLDAAVAFFAANPQTAVVCGRCRERFPDASIYNRLCDMEWNTPIGDAQACGGNAMIRAAAFSEVGGYRPDVLAAEDDELCLRLRRMGWKIARIEGEMVLHDAAMTRFWQWWRRAKRAGQAYAQGYALHGRSPDRHFARDCARIIGWAFILPLVVAMLLWPTHGFSLLLLGAYPVIGVRIYRKNRGRGWDHRSSAWNAFFTVLSKFPAMLGLSGFYFRRLFRRNIPLIEHKQIAVTS